MRLELPQALQDEIVAAARLAFPAECCGLLEGWRQAGWVIVTAVHAARNLAAEGDRFEIDPADHCCVLRECRARGTAVVGCYHSHPGGVVVPSAHDRAGAAESGFIWLIAAPRTSDTCPIAAYRFDGRGFLPVDIAETASLDPVGGTRL
jgi:proteasome lid subunit RPN8/RPN11